MPYRNTAFDFQTVSVVDSFFFEFFNLQIRGS